MTKIDINAIKPGDQVQVANGDWYEAVSVSRADDTCTVYKPGEVINVYVRITEHNDTALGAVSGLITAHKPAAAPEPPAEWVTDALWHHVWDSKYSNIKDGLNKALREKYGPPPVIKTATGEEEGGDWVLWWDGIWTPIRRENLDPGDRYVELPKCCGEGEA